MLWAWRNTESLDETRVAAVDVSGAEKDLGVLAGPRREWAEHRLKLTGLAGNTIRLRFDFDSDGLVTWQGIWLDDLKIEERGCAGR